MSPQKSPLLFKSQLGLNFLLFSVGIILANTQEKEQFEKLGPIMRVPDGTNILSETRMKRVR